MRTNIRMQSGLVIYTRLGHPTVNPWMYSHKTLKRFPLRMYPTCSAKNKNFKRYKKTLLLLDNDDDFPLRLSTLRDIR